eukprot:jgi/Psemu1/252171/estExt_Genewise1Plus.C_420001
MKDEGESEHGSSLEDVQLSQVDLEVGTEEIIQEASNQDVVRTSEMFSSRKREERESVNYESKEKDEKRKQLEAQARQRSKQQSIRNERVNSDQNFNTERRQTVPKVSKNTVVVGDPVRKQTEAQQQKEIAEAILRTDGNYKPSSAALANTSRMLKEICGFNLSDYKGGKEFIHKKSNVSVYVGRALSVPIRVTTPGSFVEFSIRKKGSDFDFGLLVVPDKGNPIDVKKTAQFTKHSGKGQNLLRDTVLVGAACAPSTLQFKFENKQSTLLEKVVLSYDIKVTLPSKEMLVKARKLRTEACLRTVEEDLLGMSGGFEFTRLEEEIEKLQAQIEVKSEEIGSLKYEERRWNALIAKMEAGDV